MPQTGARGLDLSDAGDREIYRFLTNYSLAQNQLMYSRLHLMFAIEVAGLAGAMSQKGLLGILLLSLATTIVFFLWRLAVRDRHAQLAYAFVLDPIHEPLGIRLIPPGPASRW